MEEEFRKENKIAEIAYYLSISVDELKRLIKEDKNFKIIEYWIKFNKPIDIYILRTLSTYLPNFYQFIKIDTLKRSLWYKIKKWIKNKIGGIRK